MKVDHINWSVKEIVQACNKLKKVRGVLKAMGEVMIKWIRRKANGTCSSNQCGRSLAKHYEANRAGMCSKRPQWKVADGGSTQCGTGGIVDSWAPSHPLWAEVSMEDELQKCCLGNWNLIGRSYQPHNRKGEENDEDLTIIQNCKELLSRAWLIEIKHIFREANRVAE